MLLRIIFTILLLFASFSAFAQPNLDWVAVSQSQVVFSDYVEDVFVDGSGNTYACGSFSGTIDFGVYSATTSASSTQCFVVKYNSLGVAQWAISSTGDDAAYGHSIYVDADNAVYVAGHHSSTTTTFGSLSLNSNASQEFFVLKLSPSGVPTHILGPDFISNGKNQALAITGEGNSVYIAGFYFQNPIAINGLSTLSPTQEDIFVARLDTAITTASWVKSYGSSKKDRASGIAVDGNDVFVTGFYGNGACTFTAAPTDFVLPNYTTTSIWLLKCASSDGSVDWATSAGSPNAKCISTDITAAGGEIYLTGAYSDGCQVVATPETSAPFVYSTTLSSNGGTDIFVGKYDYNGDAVAVWSEGGSGDDIGNGITYDASCSEVQVCGTFGSSINFGGTTPLNANGRDLFVSSYSPTGVFNWAFQESSSGNETASKIHANNGRTSFGGDFSAATNFGTSPIQLLNNNGAEDHFVASFQCANAALCGPEIICPINDTVSGDPTCNYLLTDYIGTEVVIDNCGTGYTVSQSPPVGTVIGSGVRPITMMVSDNSGNSNVCIFNVVVEADVNPVVVNCGDLLVNQSTLNHGNTSSNFSCTNTTTPGEDTYYQITVPAGNHFLYVTLDSVVDANDQYLNTFWVGSNCPLGSSCVSADSINVSTGNFSNGSKTKSFLATGPGTYFFVVDSQNDHIDEYDIEFSCLVSGIEFDTTGCSAMDSNSDGVVAYVNGSDVLDIEPCETVTICHDVFVMNVNDWEWMDSVNMKLGPCYTNINAASFTPNSPPLDNGFYDTGGEWDAVYDLSTNSIIWDFSSSTGNAWGDGNNGLYNCNLYSFCFEADITSGCTSSDSLNIAITINDDGLAGTGTSIEGFASVLSRDFNLVIPDPNFSYTAAQFCQGESNPVPAALGTTGGEFTGTAGIVFTDGSPSSTGTIDLSASSVGPHTITYSLGNCPITQNFNLIIVAEDDATFSYSGSSFCQEDADPILTSTGTSGGLFSEVTGNLSLNPSTGLIDLSASPQGIYWVVYSTNGTCPDVDSTQITINSLDDATFYYSAATFCEEDSDPNPFIAGVPGGVFSEVSGDLSVASGTGIVDLSASVIGTYWVVYSTNGTCPNMDSVQITINAQDNPTFNYGSTAYCPTDADPSPTFAGTLGGIFSEATGNLSLASASGLIDLSASIPGTYWVVYTTNGICPNADSTQITIYAEDDATFYYSAPAFCQEDINPTSTITGVNVGLFSEITGGLSIAPSNGGINLINSTVGTYWVVYTTGGTCPNADSVQVTINEEDDPSFDYTPSAFCPSDTDPTPNLNGTAGGNFSESTGNLSIAPNGLIDLSASIPGTYWVVYTTTGICPNVDSTQITINALDDATFNYSAVVFCQYDTDPAATITGLTGGTFSEVTGNLNFDPSSGVIDLSASMLGTYWIVYTTNGTCPNADSVQITINEEDDPSFDYTPSAFCPSDTDPTPNLNGTAGGNFSESTGNLSIAPNGLIDLSASIPGTYWVVYTTTGICPNVDSTQITINQKDDATISYSASAFCKEELDPSPNTPITPGGVYSEITGVLSISSSTGLIDLGMSATGTYWVVYSTNGICPYSDSTQVTINSEDTANFTLADAFCLGGNNPTPVILGTSGGTFFASSDISLLSSSTGEIDLSLTNPGGPYEYKYVTNGACSDSSSIFITFYSAPIADAGPDQSIGFHPSTVLSAELPFNETGSWFSVDESLTFSDITDPNSTVNNLMPGTYEIQWSATNGVCPAGKDKMIIVVADIFIPQAITPNNDGDNDLFALNINDDVECSVEIFNRWGQTVYKNTNYQNEWSGNDMKGKELSNDTYFYVIDINQDTRYKGYVVIKR